MSVPIGPERPLEGIRVIDVTFSKAPLCGRVLGDLGAQVTKIESARKPGQAGGADEEDQWAALCYDANKRSVTLDLETEEGRQRLLALLRSADILIHSEPADRLKRLGLGYDALKETYPGLIVVSITGFGQSGPYSAFKDPDLICQAMGGLMHEYGRPERAPLMLSGDQAYQVAAITGAAGALTTLIWRDKSGRGQHVDVSAVEALATISHRIANYAAFSLITPRAHSRNPTYGAYPSGVFKTKDGYVYVVIIAPRHWEVFYRWLGEPDEFKDQMWRNRHFRVQNHDILEPVVEEFFRGLTTQEVCRRAREDSLLMVSLNTLAEFLGDAQVRHRGYIQEAVAPNGSRVRLSTSPIVIDGERCPVSFNPGQGGDRPDAPAPKLHASSPAPAFVHPGRSVSSQKPALPLSGIRVVDLTLVVAGPTLTRVLAEFGAEVWRFESEAHPQRGRGGAGLHPMAVKQQHIVYADLNRNKKLVACNLETPQGRELLYQLIAQSDVVVTGVTPRILDRWGLGYDRLRRVRPDIILACLTGHGLDGPRREEPGLAVTASAHAGLYRLWNYPDEDPPVASVLHHPDYVFGHYGAIAVMALLHRRNRTGAGGLIDISHMEASSSLLAPAFVRYLADGHLPQPEGNKRRGYAPFGCYRCLGEDRWCAIAVKTDDEWNNLCEALGDPRWAKDAMFSTGSARESHLTELDQHIEQWTTQHTPHQVMRILQSAGVPAGIVASAEDLYLDPHLRERGMVVQVQDPVYGMVEYPGIPIKLSETPGVVAGCGPAGQDNDELLTGLLGTPGGLLSELAGQGILR